MTRPTSPASQGVAQPARVTLKDVAADAGVSVGAVSDIVNRGRASHYTAETRDRVLASITALGYRASRAAQDLRRGWSNTAGVILTHNFENPYYARLFNELKTALEENRQSVEMTAIDAAKPNAIREAWDRMLEHGVNGMIVGPLYYWDGPLIRTMQTMSAPSLPAITFGAVRGVEGIETVVLPDDGGGRLAAEYLFELGHRRVAFLGAYAEADAELGRGTMQEGFESALAARGRMDRRWFIESPDTGRYHTGFADALRFADAWIAADPAERPTALLCKNDQLAIAALAALHRRGITVPGQVSVMGYDNVPESGYTVPALTTVDGAMQHRTQAIASGLASRMSGAPRRSRRYDLRPPHVVSRDSVAAPGGRTGE